MAKPQKVQRKFLKREYIKSQQMLRKAEIEERVKRTILAQVPKKEIPETRKFIIISKLVKENSRISGINKKKLEKILAQGGRLSTALLGSNEWQNLKNPILPLTLKHILETGLEQLKQSACTKVFKIQPEKIRLLIRLANTRLRETIALEKMRQAQVIPYPQLLAELQKINNMFLDQALGPEKHNTMQDYKIALELLAKK